MNFKQWFDTLLGDINLTHRLILILFILLLLRIVLFIFKKFLDRAERRGLDSSARPLIYSLFSYGIYVIGLLLVLHVLGVNTTGLVAMVGAASLAIGLALKDTLSNIASGLLLLFLRPFNAKDYIECDLVKGKIIGIGLFNTTFETLDGLFLSAPNSALWGSPIVNFSRNPFRRLEFQVGIGYGDSSERALQLIQELFEKEPLFLKTPEPHYFVSELGDSAVQLTCRVWAKTGNYFELKKKYLSEIKKIFDSEKIEIPFPQRVLHIVQDPEK